MSTSTKPQLEDQTLSLARDLLFSIFAAAFRNGWTGIAQSVLWLAKCWTVRGSKPCGGEIFRTCLDRPWSPPNLLYNGYRVFSRGKAAGAWLWPPITYSAEVKEREELLLYSYSGPSWPLLGWTTPLPAFHSRCRFSIRNLRTHHALVTGIRLWLRRH